MSREYMPKYIRHEVWKRITSVIRDYKQLKAEYKNQTMSSRRLAEIKRKLRAFEETYNAAAPDTRKLIRYRFWDGKLYRDIDLPMSESTMKRRVKGFVIDLGRSLGEIE